VFHRCHVGRVSPHESSPIAEQKERTDLLRWWLIIMECSTCILRPDRLELWGSMMCICGVRATIIIFFINDTLPQCDDIRLRDADCTIM
jgi:hypothetical protein